MDATTLGLLKLGATTVVTLVAAGFGIRISSSQRDIAKQQAHTARESREIAAAKLNLDLFEERYKLFDEVWGFLSEAPNVNRDTPMPTTFTNLVPKARFLFGNEVADFMKEAFVRRSKLIMALHSRSATGDGAQAAEIRDQRVWLADAASNCHKKFAPYLDFSEWQAQRWTKGLV